MGRRPARHLGLNLSNRTWTRELRGLHIGREHVDLVFISELGRTQTCEL